MASSILTAEVSSVPIGLINIEGLLASDGVFYVGMPQIVSMDLVPPNRSIKQLESFCGMAFPSHAKLKTKLNSKAVNAISIQDFERLLARMDRLGNSFAQSLRDDLAGLSLTQLFCDAFGKKFDAEDRQEWLKTRQEGKLMRRSFTDVVRDYLLRHPELSEARAKFMYNNASDRVNKAVFGRVAKVLCRDFQCDRDSLRDALTDTELRHVAQIEEEATLIIEQNDIDPCEAVLMARAKFSFKVSDRKAC